jgi:hypothetical protein
LLAALCVRIKVASIGFAFSRLGVHDGIEANGRHQHEAEHKAAVEIGPKHARA